ncbi:hypothetical protein EOPP23_05645 [Endozoicomonas sp. OPT23]|uniref:hypothetical protein n=1 Tax=Endozoicomonas sp. OPT23 TaxID=2072845 RepID=UPI00129B30FA|nr:hypothetical protein [Endozoicomonas sp. OPT23]MRI32468.1 hypothetical protein [Endozoicomonas sp. OPT23]
MKVSLSEISQRIQRSSPVRLLIRLWQRWRVSRRDGLDSFLVNLKKDSNRPETPSGWRKVRQAARKAISPFVSDRIKIGVTYSKQAFDIECSTKLVPTRYGEELSTIIGEVHKRCGEGISIKKLRSLLKKLRVTARKFEAEVEQIPDQEVYLALTRQGRLELIEDTPENRKNHNITSDTVNDYAIPLKEFSRKAIEKTKAMADHLEQHIQKHQRSKS